MNNTEMAFYSFEPKRVSEYFNVQKWICITNGYTN
jgi:hypothetical protein